MIHETCDSSRGLSRTPTTVATFPTHYHKIHTSISLSFSLSVLSKKYYDNVYSIPVIDFSGFCDKDSSLLLSFVLRSKIFPAALEIYCLYFCPYNCTWCKIFNALCPCLEYYVNSEANNHDSVKKNYIKKFN